MTRLLVPLLVALALIITPAFGPSVASADGVCTAASPSFSGKLPGNGAGQVLTTQSAVYITAVCVTFNGSTTTLVQGGVLTPIGDGACYFVYKSQHYAFVAQGGHWTASCPSFRLTLRTARSVG